MDYISCAQVSVTAESLPNGSGISSYACTAVPCEQWAMTPVDIAF